MTPVTGYVSRFVDAADGLRLHVRDHGNLTSDRVVVCLPGLARTAADFDPLAAALLEADGARRIVALDYRGRGLSDWDSDPGHYDPAIESRDILTVLVALGIARAVVVGTSRGGLHAMALAKMRPSLLAGVVLNDIGPVLEPEGLARIQGYVGKLPSLASWDEAAAVLRRAAGAQFTGLSNADWAHYARTTFAEQGPGHLAVRYDPALAVNLAKLDPGALPALWDSFDALRPVPLMIVRGANSDLLSATTLEAMVARHPDCLSWTVPGQGHAPLLTDRPTLKAIDGFVARCFTAPPPD